MIDWWGPIIHEYYSGTECCGITALSDHQAHHLALDLQGHRMHLI